MRSDLTALLNDPECDCGNCTPDAATTASQRFDALPDSVRVEFEALVHMLRTNITGPETALSFDALVNDMFEPHGLAVRTHWDPAEQTIRQEITTLEAAERPEEKP